MAPPAADWLALGTWDKKKQEKTSYSSHLSQAAVRTGLLHQIKTEIAELLLRDKMNILLLVLPFAVISKAAGWPAGATFLLSLLPLCSLAERLGMITEQLAMYTNDTVGGLLNATFGNATEVIIAAFAIQKGLLRVVKLTLLGSIISNLLLVMGSAFVAGGIFHSTQKFNQQGINVNSGLLILSVVAIMLPTLLSSTADDVKDFSGELALSRFESLLMLLCYALFLVFQLVTHRHLYEDSDVESAPGAAAARIVTHNTSCCDLDTELPTVFSQAVAAPSKSLSREFTQPTELELVHASSSPVASNSQSNGTGKGSSSGSGSKGSSSGPGQGRFAAVEEDLVSEQVQIAVGDLSADGEQTRLMNGTGLSVEIVQEKEEEKVLSRLGCFVWLALVTVLISLLSDYIMDAITEASKQLRIPMPFLTTIVVPIVGNAAEHASALIFAIKNRMEISLGVAMGSSTQVGVLVVPFCVILAWTMGQPLDLNFNEFEALVLFISVLLAALMVQDGTSNWLKGAMLILVYMFIAAGFWVHKDPSLTIGVEGDPSLVTEAQAGRR